MNRRNPLLAVHLALAHARHELPELYRWWPTRFQVDEMDILCWGQTWPSTACGHNGVGGAAMTRADVVALLTPTGHVAVYSNGALLYAVERPSELLRRDLERRHIRPAHFADEYEAPRP